MKLKGISAFEQHADKAVLGAMGVVFMGVIAQQLLTSPNNVKIGNATYPPAQAFGPVEEEARKIEGQLIAPATGMPDVKPFTLTEKLSIGSTARTHIEPHRLALGEPVSLGASSTARQVASGTYGLPTIAAPTNVIAHPYLSTINPLEVVRNADLAKVLPAQQPFDKAAVSIEATFDGTALRAALEGDPDGAGPQEPLPLAWWRDVGGRGDGVQIVGVEVQRETLRLPDGSTPASATIALVPSMPGRPDYRSEWNKVKSIADVPQYLDLIRGNAEQIQRPGYYTTIAGPEWTPPSEAPVVTDVSETSAKDRLKARLDEIDKSIIDLEQKLQAAGGPRTTVPPPNETPEQRRTRLKEEADRKKAELEAQRQQRGPGGGPGGARPGLPSDPRSTELSKPTQNAATIETQLRGKKTQRERLVKQLEAMGEKVASAAKSATETTLGFYDDPAIRLWVHDVSAQPGATYRYRTRVIVNNPAFGRNLQDSQKDLAKNNTIASDWSDWTGEIPVDSFEYFFVTNADPSAAPSGRPRASMELYQFYYGFFRVARLSAEPGDVIAGNANLPELKLADMDKLKQANIDPTAATPTTPAGTRPGGEPSARDPRRGGGLEPADPRTALEQGRAPGTPPAAATDLAGGDLLTQALPRDRRLQALASLLDVVPAAYATSAGGVQTERFSVVFRNQNGTLAVRSPDEDRARDAYKRVLASEKLGQTQGVPVIKPVEEKRVLPTKKNQEPAGKPPGGG